MAGNWKDDDKIIDEKILSINEIRENFDDSKKSEKGEEYVDNEKGLDVLVERSFLNQECAEDWFEKIIRETRWFRVNYKSHRFEKECETPCWTAFYGGQPCYSPYNPIPNWLSFLVDKVSVHLSSSFNAILLRLYFDGNDEIAWHTDGRTFLGDSPTIASLSLGASATFQMRRMNNVWPSLQCSTNADLKNKDDGVDKNTPIRNFKLNNGDLMVMRGSTQKHWHHRVPKERARNPRININFRYIIPDGEDAERGQKSYYKYMVHGDCNPNEVHNRCVSYQEIMKKRGGMRNFLQPSISQKTRANPSTRVLSSNASTSLLHTQTSSHNCELEQRNLKNHDSIQRISCESKFDFFADSKHNLRLKNQLDDKQLNSFLKTEKDIDKDVFTNLPYSIQKEIMLEKNSPKRLSTNKSSQEQQIKSHMLLCSKRATTSDKNDRRTKKKKNFYPTSSSKTKSIQKYFGKR